MFKLKDVDVVDVNSVGTIEITRGGYCETCYHEDIELALGLSVTFSDDNTELIQIGTESEMYDGESLTISIIKVIQLLTSTTLTSRMSQMTKAEFISEFTDALISH